MPNPTIPLSIALSPFLPHEGIPIWYPSDSLGYAYAMAMAKRAPRTQYLSDFEKSLYSRCRDLTPLSAETERQLIRGEMRHLLTETTVEFTAGDGSEVCPVTPLTAVVAGAIRDAIENPSMEKVKTMAQVMGEFRDVQEVRLSKVDEFLRSEAIDVACR